MFSSQLTLASAEQGQPPRTAVAQKLLRCIDAYISKNNSVIILMIFINQLVYSGVTKTFRFFMLTKIIRQIFLSN